MESKFRSVKNPLTTISGFGIIAEGLSVVALNLLNQENQRLFLLFVILFPILITILFFITLFFKPKVLYAPSDFKDEENFLKMMGIKNRTLKKAEEISKIKN